jgi:hypothetical protein
MKLVPFQQAVEEANEWLKQGVTVYQRFACEGCGNDTLGIDEPNVFYKSGQCDLCGHITDLEKTGCNYLVLAAIGVK